MTEYINGVAQVEAHGAAQHTNVTREVFLGVGEGWVEVGVIVDFAYHPVAYGTQNENAPKVYFEIKVPDDFVSFTKIEAVWASAAAAGNAYWHLRARYGALGELNSTHSDFPDTGATACGGASIISVQEPANPLTLASLAAGDYIGIEYYRNGVHANDTLDAYLYLFGILFTYTANQ